MFGRLNAAARSAFAGCGLILFGAAAVSAAPVTDPNDPRNWQGATVGTFAQLVYGADTPANRQLVVDNQLLDDGIFSFAGATAAAMIFGGGAVGQSTDTTGTGDFNYVSPVPVTPAFAGGAVDAYWVQTSGTIGGNIWDLGAPATKAAIFNTIDHGPLPQEAIESTVYLSNDQITWTPAVTEKVWLEGWQSNLGIKWDGFVYAVGTGTSAEFRYASIIWGGPGGLQSDGDNEINGVMGLDANFIPVGQTPLPAALPLFASGLVALGLVARRRKKQVAA
jgi:hypothetical protein